MFRAGDHVHHGPSNEDWVLAFGGLEDGTGKVAPCGWPACLASEADCQLVKAATDNEHMEILRSVADMQGCDFRAVRARGYLGSLPTGGSGK